MDCISHRLDLAFTLAEPAYSRVVLMLFKNIFYGVAFLLNTALLFIIVRIYIGHGDVKGKLRQSVNQILSNEIRLQEYII